MSTPMDRAVEAFVEASAAKPTAADGRLAA
jgi:hypothetical protein